MVHHQRFAVSIHHLAVAEPIAEGRGVGGGAVAKHDVAFGLVQLLGQLLQLGFAVALLLGVELDNLNVVLGQDLRRHGVNTLGHHCTTELAQRHGPLGLGLKVVGHRRAQRVHALLGQVDGLLIHAPEALALQRHTHVAVCQRALACHGQRFHGGIQASPCVDVAAIVFLGEELKRLLAVIVEQLLSAFLASILLRGRHHLRAGRLDLGQRLEALTQHGGHFAHAAGHGLLSTGHTARRHGLNDVLQRRRNLLAAHSDGGLVKQVSRL